MDLDDLVPMHEYLAALVPLAIDELGHDHVKIASVIVESPIELDVVSAADGTLALNCSPPLYYVETSFDASLHRMRITIAEESD